MKSKIFCSSPSSSSSLLLLLLRVLKETQSSPAALLAALAIVVCSSKLSAIFCHSQGQEQELLAVLESTLMQLEHYNRILKNYQSLSLVQLISNPLSYFEFLSHIFYFPRT